MDPFVLYSENLSKLLEKAKPSTDTFYDELFELKRYKCCFTYIEKQHDTNCPFLAWKKLKEFLVSASYKGRPINDD
jgi:hypothetical protein